MRSLLIITQKVDENDDLLGFFVDWIEEFKKHIPSVKVIALNSPKKSWIRLFLRMLWYVPQSDAVFAHMSPIFVVIAGRGCGENRFTYGICTDLIPGDCV